MRERNGPKILYFDLETLVDLREVMKVFPSLSDYPGRTLKASINSIICFGYKWEGDKRARCISAWDESSRWKRSVNDDSEICRKAWEIIKQADVIVTHNGKRFDEKFLRTRMLIHGLPPLPKIHHVDTCQVARSKLLMFDNRLNTLAKRFTSKRKIDNGGWDLWCKVLERDRKACADMSRYCRGDVEVLEAIFNVLRPSIKLPNSNMWSMEKARCHSCGSLSLVKEGTRTSETRIVQRFSCSDCGSWSSLGLRDPFPKGAV